MTLNQAKVQYKDAVEAAARDSLGKMPAPPYRFNYVVYPGSNRAFDLANVLPVIQKFTDDALIELKLIPDDNHKVVSSIRYDIGAVDKEYPRAELTIESLQLG
jgi:hypothetical protein